MNTDRHLLGRIEAMPQPRHLFVLPTWADPVALSNLLEHGYLTCDHCQRDEKGGVQVVMGLQLTQKAKHLLQPPATLPGLVVKGSLAGASLTAMSVVILYLG